MSRFSASDAALEGFQVIRVQWRVVLGWCLFSLLGYVGVVVLSLIVIAAVTLAAATREQANALGGAAGGTVLFLGWSVIQWMVLAALYRMSLRPAAEPGLYHLRLSRDEGRLFGLWLGVLAVFGGLMVAGYLGLRRLGEASGAASAIGTLAFLAVMTWLALRISLAGPANFATGRFGLAESWRLTRGQAWALLGMVVLALCLLALIAIVLFIATALIQAAIGGFHTLSPVDLSDRGAFAERPGAFVFALAAELAIAPIYLVIAQAPFVAAYKALSAPPAD